MLALGASGGNPVEVQSSWPHQFNIEDSCGCGGKADASA